MKATAMIFAVVAPIAALAAPGDAEVTKWAHGAKGAFYIIPAKGEFKVFEKVWKEKFKNPLFRFGNHTWSHNGFDDYDGAVEEFRKCTDYLRENVPGKKGRLISYAQPGVKAGRWNINGEQEAAICKAQGLVARPTFRDHGATYHLKNKDDMIAKAKKAANEGIAEYVIFHGVEVDDPKRGYQDFWAMPVKEYIPFFDEVAAMRDRGEIWVADHVSVHQYETERATAKIKKLGKTAKGYRFSVTCDADPKLYDCPLTVKVEVPKTWKNAKDGFVYVDVVPNGKPFEVSK